MSTLPVSPNEVKAEKDIPNSDRSKMAMESTGISNHTLILINNKSDIRAVNQDKDCDTSFMQDVMTSEDLKRSSRFMILVVVVAFLVIGRYNVPFEEVDKIQDKVMNFLTFANKFINQKGNEIYRDALQMLCSLLMDLTFAITFGYWLLRGTNVRLPLSLGIFYITRALVQQIWVSPFPEDSYWESPGFPSLVVPYGAGSDFFFSGHSGFLVICACEWNKLKNTRIRNFIILATIYTIFILLTYRIHYSIDVFTGVFFSEWCFGKVDLYIGDIEQLFKKVFRQVQGFYCFYHKSLKNISLAEMAPQEQQQEQELEGQP